MIRAKSGIGQDDGRLPVAARDTVRMGAAVAALLGGMAAVTLLLDFCISCVMP